MKRISFLVLATLLVSGSLSFGQLPLSTIASQSIGHPKMEVYTTNPNLVEGRELFAPQAVVVDTTSSPPRIYVSDPGNNRVLGWRDANAYFTGQMADLAVGQADLFSTVRSPATPGSRLNSPSGLAVDRNGNLWVVDSGNNRVVRYARPFDQPAGLKLADFVVGQPSFESRDANSPAVSASTLRLVSGGSPLRATITFDGEGNLWLVDAGNHRVLRYPAGRLGPGNPNGPAADVVLGQADFTTNRAVNDAASLVGFQEPSGLAFDAAGRLFVSDGMNRVVVFTPPYGTGRNASRVLGGLAQNVGAPARPDSFFAPEGVFTIENDLYVVDTRNHRIVVFDPFDRWPASPAFPQGKAVIGQENLTANQANRGRTAPAPDSLRLPVHGFHHGGQLWVVDGGNHRVLSYAAAPYTAANRALGQATLGHGSPNLVEGREFNFGVGASVVIDSKSNPPRMYISDPANHRVLGYRDARRMRPGQEADLVIGQPDKFTTMVNHPFNDASRPNQSGLFSPTGLAVDSEGNLFVADTGNARVLRFPTPFAPGRPTPQVADIVIGQQSFDTRVTDPTARTMRAPLGVALTQGDNLLVSDVQHNRVLLFFKPFSNGMAASAVIGQSDFTAVAQGSGPNRFNAPLHISVDGDDRLYVADPNNRRIQIFDRVTTLTPDPFAVLSITESREGDRLDNPISVYVNPRTGEIWVAEANRNRCLRFRKFEELLLSALPVAEALANQPIYATLDGFGNLAVAEAIHRVAFYFPTHSAVNAATFRQNTISPGMIASIFSPSEAVRFSTGVTVNDKLPVPKELGGVEVLVNDIPSAIYFTSPGQINFQVSMNAPSSGIVQIMVVEKASGRVIASNFFQATQATPGLFTSDASGTGQIAALNQNNTVNTPQNPAARGEVIQAFGTGQGFVPNSPPDGEPATGITSTQEKPRVLIGTAFVDDADVLYSGLAPGLVGVWQINVKIPMSTAPLNNVPFVVLYRSIPSNRDSAGRIFSTTIAVKP